MFDTKKTLIVVYKDEMLLNFFKKMVETRDDVDGEVVGTTDDSIEIVSWTEDVWLDNKKAGNIKNKILFLGDIKGTDNLIPVVDVKHDEFGVKYGWAGHQAILFAELDALYNQEAYEEFHRKLCDMPVPDILKTNKTHCETSTSFGRLLDVLIFGAGVYVIDVVKAVKKAKELERQMLFYGAIRLYYDGLESFMNS